jgi:DNA-directed RNA polymerase specialized sigma24 family protein
MRDWIAQNYARLMVFAAINHGQLAGDLVQDACIRLIDTEIQPGRDPFVLFVVTMKRLAVDYAKRMDNRALSIDAPIDAADEDAPGFDVPIMDPTPLETKREQINCQKKVNRCLARLSLEHRNTLQLAVLGRIKRGGRLSRAELEAQGSYELASLVMDVPLNTTRSRPARARAAFAFEWNRKRGRPKGS